MPKEAVFIHLGFPRSGSTSLQRHLFDKHSGILNLGKPYSDKSLEELYAHLYKLFRTEGKYQIENQDIIETIKSGSGKSLFISDEAVLFNVFNNFSCVVDRFLAAFDNCKFLIIIRNQIDIIKSYYTYSGHVPKPNLGNYPSIPFDKWLSWSLDNFYGSFLYHLMYFSHTVKLLHDKGGRENVKVLLFEDYIKDTAKFSHQFSSFLEIDDRETLSLLEQSKVESKSYNLSPLGKRLSKSTLATKAVETLPFLKNLKRVVANRVDFSVAQEIVPKLFSGDNRFLDSELNLDLKRYSYPLQNEYGPVEVRINTKKPMKTELYCNGTRI